MASIISSKSPNDAVKYYLRGTKIDSSNARSWLGLAYLLEESSPSAARDAYLSAYYLGGPGKQGCYGAGRLAEEIGDTPMAVKYYRLSSLLAVRNKAKSLEDGLENKPDLLRSKP